MKTRVGKGPVSNLFAQKRVIVWLVYALSTLLLLVVQTAPRFFPAIGGARPMPLLTFVICVAVLGGARTGVTVGVIAGVLWGVFSSRLFGFDALLLMLLGLAAGLLVEWLLRANFYTALLLCAGGILLYVLFDWLFFYVIFQRAQPFAILFKVLLPSGLYTVLLTPIVYAFSLLIARFVRRKENG